MIRTETLSVAFGRRVVVREVTASFAPGRLTGIIGPNGAGKSSFARAVLGLIPATGRALIDGKDVGKLSRARLARLAAYLPQGQVLHWPLSVERLVGLGRLPHLGPISAIAQADLAAIERAMVRADVLHLRHCVATELSGGERSRALLARSLAVEAPALIADEPLANLDPGHQVDVMDVLKAEAAAGRTVIAVLHDLTMAARYCDQLILMQDGGIAAVGTPQAVLTPSMLRAVYGIEAEVALEGDLPRITVVGRCSR